MPTFNSPVLFYLMSSIFYFLSTTLIIAFFHCFSSKTTFDIIIIKKWAFLRAIGFIRFEIFEEHLTQRLSFFFLQIPLLWRNSANQYVQKSWVKKAINECLLWPQHAYVHVYLNLKLEKTWEMIDTIYSRNYHRSMNWWKLFDWVWKTSTDG